MQMSNTPPRSMHFSLLSLFSSLWFRSSSSLPELSELPSLHPIACIADAGPPQESVWTDTLRWLAESKVSWRWAKVLLIRGCRRRVGKACWWREHPRGRDASSGAFPGLRFHLLFCRTEHKCKTFSQLFLTGGNRILNGSALNTGPYCPLTRKKSEGQWYKWKDHFKKKNRIAGQPPPDSR